MSNGSVDGGVQGVRARHALDGEPLPDGLRQVVKDAVDEALQPFFSKVAEAFVLLEDRQVALQHALDEVRRRVEAGGPPGGPTATNGSDRAVPRVEAAASRGRGR